MYKVYEISNYTQSKYPEGGIVVSESYYGFDDDCSILGIDNLKDSGNYYFELGLSFQKNGEEYTDCAELNIFTEGKDTFMNLYYSSRQQYVTYKKIDSLPKQVQQYLQKQGIRIGLPQKAISSAKAIIYSQPNIFTKMYLIKGDIITVLEEKEGWIKIEYEGKKLITGWVKKEDVKE
jgi:hypothetical protein